MGRLARCALGVAVACCAYANTQAAPAFRILYHEAIRPQTRSVSGHTRNMSFDAYGQRFNLVLQSNLPISRAVPANRPDIETLKGELEGQPGSWVRMTHTRTGWHGIISDGRELYAVEPASDIAAAMVQPSTDVTGSTPVMYRLKDALLPVGPAFCEVLNPDGSVYTGSGSVGSIDTASPGRMTALKLFDSIAAEAAQVTAPDLELTVGVVADYEFYREFSDDPEGTMIARMDVVDGIWSSQVGVKISLAPLTVIKTSSEPFTKTVAADLLAQVRQYRGSHTAQRQTGLTHLMTGRDLDGEIVGIAYMGSVCDSQNADSLSEGNHSTLMSGLIAAHELGHNFNAPHDGETGACSATPETYLMAPVLNFNNQFSSCSLDQINARIKTAQCLVTYEAPDVQVDIATSSVAAVEKSPFTISFVAHAMGDDPSKDVSALATLPATLTLQSSTTSGGTCTSDGASVTCSLGTLQPHETRQIDLTLAGTVAGNAAVAVSVSSSNDSVVDNNSGQISVQVAAAATPSAPVSSSSSGNPTSGGGGGGSLDVMVLLALGAATAARRPAVTRPGPG